MKLRIITFVSMAVLALTYDLIAFAKPPKPSPNSPQTTVVCTGWHALCDAADDCKVVGTDKAGCACWKVKEPYIVVTSKIKNPDVQLDTLRRCTKAHPCGVDDAPVCAAIKSGQFKVDGIPYKWVSTYSYRGWCEKWRPADCSGSATGDWADCMTSPCTVDANPADPERPLNCQCSVLTSDFVGINGGCDPRGPDYVQSTFERELWDFHNNTYTIPPAGYEFVKEACSPLKSDEEK